MPIVVFDSVLPALVTAAASLGPEATFMPIDYTIRVRINNIKEPTCKHDGVIYVKQAGKRSGEDLL